MTDASSPEASGGAGTVLEHRYGATLLAALLAHGPVPGLGPGAVPVRVQFQHPHSPVDDLVVTANADTATLTWHVAVRRTPEYRPGHAETVALFERFVRVLLSRPVEVEEGVLRLGLAVRGPHGPSTLVRGLAAVAATQPTAELFREAIAARSSPLQTRLRLVDGMGGAAVSTLDVAPSRPGEPPIDWTWAVLRRLKVVVTFLEDDESDTVAAVDRLRGLVDGDASAADELRVRLNGLAARYANTAAVIDEAALRADLVGEGAIGVPADLAAGLAALAENERMLSLDPPPRYE